jgi:uncharacterized protein
MTDDAPYPSPAHGQLCYLQMPAIEVSRSAAFYEQVFGWEVELTYASFTSPGLIGQWVTDRAIGAGAGPVLWLSVDSIEETLILVAAAGGDVLEPVSPDGPDRLLATIRDPAGNSVGVVQHGVATVSS